MTTTVEITTVEQLAAVARSYVSTLIARMIEAQAVLKQFSRDDFKIELCTVDGDGVVYDYNGVDAEYEHAALLYILPDVGTADCYLESQSDVIQAILAGKKTTTTSDEMSHFRDLSQKLFKLVDLRGDKIFATGLQSQIVVSQQSIKFRMIVEAGDNNVCYTNTIENGKATETFGKIW